MLQKPKISVILPVYNDEAFISETIESILNQTFQNFELIIINDGSSDSTYDMINSKKDDRIKLINNKKNHGIAYSLNRGLEMANSDFIARIDSNDIALPIRLEKQYTFLINNPNVGLVTSPVIEQYQDGFERIAGDYLPSKAIPANLLFTNCIYHTAVMLRSRAIPKEGFNENYACEDYHMWSKILFFWQIKILREPLTKVRDLEGGLRYLQKNKDDSIRVRKELLCKIGMNKNIINMGLHDKIRFFKHNKVLLKKIKFIIYFNQLYRNICKSKYKKLFDIDDIISKNIRSMFKSEKNLFLFLFYLLIPLKLKNIPLITGHQIFKIVSKNYFKRENEVLEGELYNQKWNYLNSLSELGHYSIINGYISFFKSKNILDVGCGEGILFSKVNPELYDKYVGIDISKTAIKSFQKIKNKKTELVISDLTQYNSNKRFDLIIFCESLQYPKDPIKVLTKYKNFLKSHGKIIISIYKEKNKNSFWDNIPEDLTLLDSNLLQNNGLCWRIDLYEKS